jgi:hypothetical protein
MLTNQIQSLFRPRHELKSFMCRHSGKVAALVVTGTVGIGVFACLHRVNTFIAEELGLAESAQHSIHIENKVDYLIGLAARGDWERFVAKTSIFIVILLVIAIVFGIVSAILADTTEPSFLVLNREAEKVREISLRAERKAWIGLIVSIITSIAASVIASFVYAYLIK